MTLDGHQCWGVFISHDDASRQQRIEASAMDKYNMKTTCWETHDDTCNTTMQVITARDRNSFFDVAEAFYSGCSQVTVKKPLCNDKVDWHSNDL